MIGIKFLTLLFVVLCESKRSLVPQAILELYQKFYGETSVRIAVYFTSDRMEIFELTIKLLSQVKKLRVLNLETNVNEDGDIEFHPGNDAIFIFDTIEKYLKYYDYIHIGKRMFFAKDNILIYCAELTSQKLQTIITNDAVGSYLIKENNVISLYTLTSFTKQLCHVPQLEKINRFSNSVKKWLKSTHQKLSWLHVQCFGRREISFYILENK